MTVAATSPSRTRDPSPSVARDAALLALAALALRLPAFFAQRHLHPDDGVYGMSVVAMRAGGVPYKEVFSSQGPLHLPLLYAGDLLGLRTFDAPRVTPVLAGVAATVLTYLIARRIASRTGALIGAAIVATSGSMLWVTGPITSDGPMLAIVLGAFYVALRYRDRPTTARAVLLGVLVAAALLVKPALAFLACIAPAVVMVRERRRRDIAFAAGAAAVFGLLVSLPFGLGRVWRQTVDYQLSSEREQSVFANAVKVLTTLTGRDMILVGFVVLALVAFARRTPAREEADRVVLRLLWLWTGLVLVFLVLQPALWRNHVSSAIIPIALLVALRPPPLRWIAIAAIVVVPLQLFELRDILRPAPYGGPTAAAHEALEALPDGAWAISDEPGLVWRSHSRTPDQWVDASIKRQQQGQITAASITKTAATDPVCAVLVWSKSHWGSIPNLDARLRDVGYRPVGHYFGQEGARVLYERAPCAPAGT